jgi:transmembrane sensor
VKAARCRPFLLKPDDVQPQDLIENESFRRWVFRPTETDTVYWEAWIAGHPENRENADLARQFLLSAKGDLPPVSDQTVTTNVGRIMAVVDNTDEDDDYPLHKPWWNRPWALTGVAASVLIALLGGVWLLRNFNRFASSQETVAQQPAVRMIEIMNDKAQPRLVRLSDGSMVQLQAQAKIRFPESFAARTREVYLSGTAFFEVTKNPQKPFLVYANSLITRVVGTSFTIYAPAKGAATRVVVRTGKVAVYPRPTKATPATASTVLLTANQQAIYRQGDVRPAKEAVQNQEQIAASLLKSRFSFRRTPLVQVFQTLEQTYGIRVEYDAHAVTHCTLTAQLDDQSLFEKLDVITASTGTTYELTADGTIRIKPGSGCQ